jgi:hypothetical protein
MKRIIGIAIGIFYGVLAGLAYAQSGGGWTAGHADLGFWWAVIGTFLGIAGLGALFGTWIHTRPAED